jgi:hypothetical protein
MRCHTLLIGITILILVIASCSPTGETPNEKTSQEVTSTIEAITQPEQTVTPIQLGNEPHGSNPQPAPSYMEIRESVDRILKTPEHPDGPLVGDDGIVDQDVVRAIGEYQALLVGRRVDNWHGWYNGHTKTPDGSINVSILMSEPPEDEMMYTDVLIWQVPETEEMRMQQFSFRERVAFSGLIVGMQSDGKLYIAYETIQSAE